MVVIVPILISKDVFECNYSDLKWRLWKKPQLLLYQSNIYDIATANIILNDERLREFSAFPFQSEGDKYASFQMIRLVFSSS